MSVNQNKKIEIAKWLLDPDKSGYLPPSFAEATAGKDDLRFLEARLDELDLVKIYKEIELPLVEILEEMHKVGIKVDIKLLEKLSKKLGKEIADLEKNIYKEAGEKFNLNSPKQLSEVLFEKIKISSEGVAKTKTGLRSTDVGSLLTIKDRHPIINFILKYRELFKIKSTYVEPLRELADKNGRVHTTFVQTGTATGRLSSQNPNLQNIPPVVREVFIPEKGYTLASFDYSQVELRVLASVADDPKMIEAFKKNKDIHTLTASQIFNVEEKKISKEQRNFAKTLNFGVVYGMGPMAFARNTGLSVDEARKFIDEYFADFAEVKRWQEKTIDKARQLGYVETLNGRKRWLPAITHPNQRFASEARRAAINMPIQGLAADIIKLAMIKIDQLIHKNKWEDKVRMLLTIHDELVFEIKENLVDEVESAIKNNMEYAFKLKIPLKVDAAVGKNWKDLEKHA